MAHFDKGVHSCTTEIEVALPHVHTQQASGGDHSPLHWPVGGQLGSYQSRCSCRQPAWHPNFLMQKVCKPISMASPFCLAEHKIVKRERGDSREIKCFPSVFPLGDTGTIPASELIFQGGCLKRTKSRWQRTKS